MNRGRTWLLGVVALAAVAGGAFATRNLWSPQGAVAQAPAQPRLIAVEVAKAVKKSTPVRIEALGTVTADGQCCDQEPRRQRDHSKFISPTARA